jgi:hypothetical protein
MNPGWKVEEHEMPRWNYLTGKIDKISEDINSPKLTKDEVIEFLNILNREKNQVDSYVNYILEGLNRGDTDGLYK